MKENILFTGANGFIGGHTLEGFKRKGVVPRGFAGDVREVDDWRKNLDREGEIIFLLAGVRTETIADFAINAGGVENLFSVAESINKLPKRVILASSQAVYMGNKIPFKETQKPLPTTIYGVSKLLAENVAQRWCLELGIPLVILRYSTVLGKGIGEESRMSGPLFAWTKAARAGEPIRVFQDGRQTRDYVHVVDVVAANWLAVRLLPPGIYNVGGGEAIRLVDLARWIKEAVDSTSEIIILGGKGSWEDPRKMLSDTTKIRDWGWKPEKAIKDAVEDFVNSPETF